MFKAFKAWQIRRAAWKDIPKNIKTNIDWQRDQDDLKQKFPMEFKEGYDGEYNQYAEKYLLKLDESLKVYPKSSRSLYHKMIITMKLEKYVKCIEVCQKLIPVIPKDRWEFNFIHFNLGKCYYRLNQIEKVPEHFQIIIENAKRFRGPEDLKHKVLEIQKKIESLKV